MHLARQLVFQSGEEVVGAGDAHLARAADAPDRSVAYPCPRSWLRNGLMSPQSG
jgi:hypothetical protein